MRKQKPPKRRLARKVAPPTKRLRTIKWKPIVFTVLLLGLSLWCLNDPAGWFRLKKIEITGHLKQVSHEEILTQAAVPRGASLMQLNLKEIQQRIEALPWVSAVTLRRLLPETLYIHVIEEQPVALITLPELHIIGEDGEIFKPLAASDPKDFPVITGLQGQKDQPVLTRRIQESIQVMATLKQAGVLHPFGLSELHWDEQDHITLTTKRSPFTIMLGGRPWGEKLQRLTKIFPYIQKEGKKPYLVKLDPKEGVIVRYIKN